MTRAVTVTSGNGGVGKTTMALNVSDALARAGHDVLTIDCAPQYGGLTDTAGFSKLLNDDHYDLTDVLLSPDRSLREIVLKGDEQGMNFDLIPANMGLQDFGQMVAQSNISGNSWTFLRWELNDADLWSDYDAVVVDAESGRDIVVRNAILATRNVLMPTENSRKGRRSVPEIQDFLGQLEQGMARSGAEVDLNLLSVVPNDTGDCNADDRSRKKYIEMDAPVPFELRKRRSLLRDSMDERMTAFEFVEQADGRPYEYEESTLKKFEALGRIVMEGNIDAARPYVDDFFGDMRVDEDGEVVVA